MSNSGREPQRRERFVLTFDDGPHAIFTPRLLDCLAKAGLKAIFFVLGKEVAAPGGREIVARAYREGHRIGSHTYNHFDLTKLEASQIRDEITRTEDLIGEFLTPCKLLRPPYGKHNPLVDDLVRGHGYQMMLWNVDSEDWKKENQPNNWIEVVADQIADWRHSTILFHDNHPQIVDSFDAFFDKVSAIPDVHLVPYLLRRFRRAISRRILGGIRMLRL